MNKNKNAAKQTLAHTQITNTTGNEFFVVVIVNDAHGCRASLREKLMTLYT